VDVSRIKSPSHLGVGFAIVAGLGVSFGSAFQAQAQIDPNAQSRVQSYTIPLSTGIAETQFGSTSEGGLTAPPPLKDRLNEKNIGACLDDPSFLVVLFYYNEAPVNRHRNQYLHHWYHELSNTKNPPTTLILQKILTDLTGPQGNKGLASKIISGFFHSEKDREFAVDAVKYYVKPRPPKQLLAGITTFPVSFCAPKATIKVIAPFNPTDETNVLKSNQNNSPGTSWGYGGTLQAFVPVKIESDPSRNFDVVGFSAQSQSVRYTQFPTKSFDSITTQAAYQLFLNAFGFQSNGARVPISPETVKNDNGAVPPLGMITVDSVAFGFQNQTLYTPAFHNETVDLFTPQITFNRQNWNLSGNAKPCQAEIPDPRKDGFCFSADFSLTFGQTFSDVASQTNTNLAFSVTPGMRVDRTDWKLTLPLTVTERAYENVAGGRQDTLFQIGPALTYAPPPFTDNNGGSYAVTFSLPVTYNQNFSTVPTDAWRGFVVMPTLTVAFQPPIK